MCNIHTIIKTAEGVYLIQKHAHFWQAIILAGDHFADGLDRVMEGASSASEWRERQRMPAFCSAVIYTMRTKNWRTVLS